MKRWRILGRIVRLALLVSVLGGAILLYRWSRAGDPRFYRFVKSRPGQVLARAFRWNGPWSGQLPEEDRPDSRMTPEELGVKRELEDEVRQGTPTHEVVLGTGQRLKGWVTGEKPDYVEFAESYRDSGGMSIRIRRERIQRVTALTNAEGSVTYRDVRLKMEFPGFHFYWRPPYAILTDESYFSVEHSVRALLETYRQFMAAFGALVARPARGRDVQVLFFSKHDQYQAYQRRYSPGMDNSTGFYSPTIDRLVVYNQGTSDQVRRALESVDKQAAAHRDFAAPSPAEQARLAEWQKQTEQRIRSFAEEQTLSTLRHEGAHQLFYTCGIHSEHRVEGEWLVEGLATYCETPRLGERDPLRVALIRRAIKDGKLIPLDALTGFRSAAGLMAFGRGDRVELAYAQSWALVAFLMQSDRIKGFFDYIRFVRDPASFREVKDARPVDLLARFLGTSAGQLAADWMGYLEKL